MIARLMAVMALKERAKVAVHNASEAAVEAAVRIAIKLVAAVLVLIAFVFGAVALFLYLATLMEPWQAMAIVAALVLVLAGIVLLLSGGGGGDRGGRRSVAAASGRRSPPPPSKPGRAPHGEEDPAAVLARKSNELGVALNRQLRDHPETAMAAAAAAGFLIGRSPRLRKLLLAGISAALGTQARD